MKTRISKAAAIRALRSIVHDYAWTHGNRGRAKMFRDYAIEDGTSFVLAKVRAVSKVRYVKGDTQATISLDVQFSNMEYEVCDVPSAWSREHGYAINELLKDATDGAASISMGGMTWSMGAKGSHYVYSTVYLEVVE